MAEIESINDLIAVVMILIRLAAVARVIYCLLKLIGSEDERGMYIRRIRHVAIFYVLAESVHALMGLFLGYLGG